ncbi:MAG: rubrerythrin family protein [Desulfosporosinus sp. BRH_c37]|nr:MAG: rubrerythrin family protein [Desulfosporosinus sp. BRH_c37]
MNTSFEVLNKILRGEHMAIEQYQAYIGELTDGPLRNHLTAILTDHKDHATRISYYIQTNGGQAEEGTGFQGVLANWKTRLTNLGEAEPIKILERLYDGEDKGLARAVQYSEQYLSSAEKEVLEPIFSDEHDHLKQLQSLRGGLYSNM